MTRQLTPIDITNDPTLAHLAEKVQETNTPLELKKGNRIVAILTPVDQSIPDKHQQKAIEETLALAGSWSDLNWEQMQGELDRIRHESKPTPPLAFDL